MAQFRVDASQVTRLNMRLKEIGGQLNDMSKPMELVGIRLLNTREDIFEQEGSPRRWKKSKRAIRDGGQTLQDTRALLNSMTVRGKPGAIFDSRPMSIEIGSSLKQSIHDKGGTFTATRKSGPNKGKTWKVRVPQRRFTNLRRQDRRAIVEVLEFWLAGLFDGGVDA